MAYAILLNAGEVNKKLGESSTGDREVAIWNAAIFAALDAGWKLLARSRSASIQSGEDRRTPN